MLSEEIKKEIEKIGERLGVEMIVKDVITVGAKKEINGEMYGDYAILTKDELQEDVYWKHTLSLLEEHLSAMFMFAEAENKQM